METENTGEFTITVHQRQDELGYIVKITEVCPQGRIARYPVGTLEEAEKLAASIARYIDGGCDVNALFVGDDR
jgi:hypothetical protein